MRSPTAGVLMATLFALAETAWMREMATELRPHGRRAAAGDAPDDLAHDDAIAAREVGHRRTLSLGREAGLGDRRIAGHADRPAPWGDDDVHTRSPLEPSPARGSSGRGASGRLGRGRCRGSSTGGDRGSWAAR